MLTAPSGSRNMKVAALSPARLSRVLDRIDAAMEEDIGVEELAALVGMSRYHFSRAVKAATGLAPFALVTRMRMDRACTLLADPEVPITQVASAVGYSNPSKFAASFRRCKGMTPSVWRQRAG